MSADEFEPDHFMDEPSKRPTMPPESEPTGRQILAAVENVSLGIASIALSISRLEASFEIMRSTVHDHGTEIAKLKERVYRLEQIEARR